MKTKWKWNENERKWKWRKNWRESAVTQQAERQSVGLPNPAGGLGHWERPECVRLEHARARPAVLERKRWRSTAAGNEDFITDQNKLSNVTTHGGEGGGREGGRRKGEEKGGEWGREREGGGIGEKWEEEKEEEEEEVLKRIPEIDSLGKSRKNFIKYIFFFFEEFRKEREDASPQASKNLRKNLRPSSRIPSTVSATSKQTIRASL